MPESTLPEHVKPAKLARREAEYSGSWPLVQFERLLAGHDDAEQASDYRVSIAVSFLMESGYPAMQGKATAKVNLTCQRCLNVVEHDMATDIRLVFVPDEDAAAHLPSDWEFMIADSEEISLLQAVEDELILALPLVAYHTECKAQVKPGQGTSMTTDADTFKAAERENPFKVLAQLKDKK